MSYTFFPLKLEVLAGAQVDDCINHAIAIAKTLNLETTFKFNDVHLYAKPDSTHAELSKRFWNHPQWRKK